MGHPQSNKVFDQILQELSGTEYACSSLEPLAGGTANFIFKGTLVNPLPDGTTSVAVKHGEGFVASMPDFQISTARCQAEEECLKALDSALPPPPGPYAVRPPKLHYFNPDTNTQVQELLPGALSLKDYALKHFSPSAPGNTAASGNRNDNGNNKATCLELGRSLGAWLRGFHDWAATQSGLRERVGENAPMRQLKHAVNYAALVATVGDFPSVLGGDDGTREVFEQLEAVARRETERGDLEVIHGDFWTGNVLLPDRPLQLASETPVFIVDWEMCQLGVRPLDLGQMIAELYELSLFKGMDEGKWLIEGFVAGYGPFDDDFAFRTALHVGTHLVCWGSRVPGWGSETQVQQVVGAGKEVILRAWRRDRAWFEVGDLACLFNRQ